MKSGEVEKTSDLIIGIDLGTTNSLAAYVKDGSPIAILDADGKNNLIPSIVHFGKEGKILVGNVAKEKLISDPRNTIYSIKRLMGKSFQDVKEMEQFFSYKVIDEDVDKLIKIEIGQKYYSPIELSAEILKALKNLIEDQLKQKVDKAVITVPAYFNDTQRQATRDAGKLAGLNVLRIVNEPTAASLAYGLGQDQNQTIAVYDLGGGTFDISILKIQNGIFEVLSTHGNTFLGGDDFDRLIIEKWIRDHKLQKTILEPAFNQALRLFAEKAKISLSTQHNFTETTQIGEQKLELKISLEEFNQLSLALIQKTIDSCEQALADAKLSKEDIDHVIMVGGSTRIPAVKKIVSNFFGKEVYDKINPDEVVALGAAIQADILAGNNKNLLLLDITPLSLGIETVGGLMDVILPRNSKIPISVARNYTTSVDGQKNLKVSVYQGERDLVADNRKLASFVLKNIPPMPAGIPKIEIQFIIDADGILKVKAKELRSGTEQELIVNSQYGLSEEEMGKMLMDSIKNAEADMKKKVLLEARNEADNIIMSTDKFLKQHHSILSESEVSNTEKFKEALTTAKENGTKDEINKAMEELNTYTTPLAHRALDDVISKSMKGKKI